MEMIIYPREDARVRLSDFKALLGAKGIEQINDIEVYHFGRACWIPALWETPHHVPYRGHALLMRHADVTHLDRFDTLLSWVTPGLHERSALLTPPATVSRKGKERMM